ncbi:hypothetical protein BVC80_1591g9 [Macleaya cordata]|uniref:Uncharacterized protein n=1 Tax=Macleaya cordata TaxID=56857 RepID=A0A200QI57_MACCD|nr:hypothetical protein BVC80_1591g9 [Macleaya cordata]
MVSGKRQNHVLVEGVVNTVQQQQKEKRKSVFSHLHQGHNKAMQQLIALWAKLSQTSVSWATLPG